MWKFLLGFLAGAMITAAVFGFFIIPQTRESYRAVGLIDGKIGAQSEIADKIERELGNDHSLNDGQSSFYNVKSTSVVVVDRNGVKTLRVIR